MAVFTDGSSFFRDDGGQLVEVAVHLVKVAFSSVGVACCDSFHGIAVLGEEVDWLGKVWGGGRRIRGWGSVLTAVVKEVSINVFEVRVEVD